MPDEIDIPTDAFLAQQAEEIRRLTGQAGRATIDIGTRLIAVKDRLPHGEFGPWLSREFSWSWRTANRLMQVARAFGQIGHGVQFEARAFYALVSSDVPEAVRQEFADRAEDGEVIRWRDVSVKLTTETVEIAVPHYVTDPDVSRFAVPVIDVTPSDAPVVTGEPEPASGAPPPPPLAVIDVATGEAVGPAPMPRYDDEPWFKAKTVGSIAEGKLAMVERYLREELERLEGEGIRVADLMGDRRVSREWSAAASRGALNRANAVAAIIRQAITPPVAPVATVPPDVRRVSHHVHDAVQRVRLLRSQHAIGRLAIGVEAEVYASQLRAFSEELAGVADEIETASEA